MAKEPQNYRLGIDLGATSLGWCMLELSPENNPTGIINMGVRIFPDGREMKSQEPLAVKRRGYRGQRRNLDRYLLRVRGLINYLLENGFLPEDQRQRDEVFKINPYYLRSKALDEELSPAEFARALIHLAKRRGFRSNRKVLSDKTTKTSEAIDNLRQDLAKSNARTLGEYLWNLYLQNADQPNTKTLNRRGIQGYTHKMGHHLDPQIKFRYEKSYEHPIFPTRDMALQEFDAIWQAQARFNPLYTDAHKDRIKDIIFFQRNLLPTQKGKCELEPDEERAPLAHPVFQEFRILQSLNNLKAVDTFSNETLALTDEQHKALYDLLSQSKEKSFAALRKEVFGKKYRDYRFNLELGNDKELKGNSTNFALLQTGNQPLIDFWQGCPLENQGKIIELVISDLDDEPTLAGLKDLGVSQHMGEQLLELNLESNYGHLSVKAMQNILPYLKQRQVYSEACLSAGYKHSEEFSGEVFTEGDLPYYGKVLKRETIALARRSNDPEADEHGKINNPTVHVALNQLRKLVNALSEKYGPPREVILELGKEARMSKDKRDALNKEMSKNKALNDKIKAFLDEHQLPWNHDNMLRVKLWWELGDDPLNRRCVYSGEMINVEDLFSHKIEIDHILPFSRTYEDTNANKVLCTHAANQFKGERTPYEAFSSDPAGYNWQDIMARANKLKDSKRRRFLSDAMKRFEDEGDLIGRMLNDTRYMSRVAMKYMWYVCGKNNVWAVTGKHTGILRAKWGLNTALGETDAKERTDHRHHAIDAFVIALTTRSLVKHVADRLASTQYRQIELLDPPWPGFSHAEFRERVNAVHVSYKPDHIRADKLGQRYQTGGALMEETAYGFVKGPDGLPLPDPDNPKNRLYTMRIDVSKITVKNFEDIVRLDLRETVRNIAEHNKGEAFQEKVKKWAAEHSIKKIKVSLSMNPAGMIPIRDQQGRVFKFMASGNNLFADVYIANPKDPNCIWDVEIVSSYAAHQPGFVPQWKRDHPKGKKVMRVFKNDVIALDGPDGGREYRRLKKMTSGILYLRELNIAKKPKELEDIGEQYSAKRLQELKARKAGIDIMGHLFDPIINEQ